MHRIEIAPMSAAAFRIGAGQSLRVVDVAGGQPGDLVAFRADDVAERLSQSRTRVEEQTCRVTAGNRLWSGAQPPRVMLTITQDTGGGHSLLYSPCCRYALEKRFGVRRDGCLEHLAAALAPHGIGLLEVPDPLSLFFNVRMHSDGRIALGRHRSPPGSTVVLRARMDCLLAVSTCSVPIEGRENSGYHVQIA
jgi:uncharacterized protein YcgI (DUF1989 family)